MLQMLLVILMLVSAGMCSNNYQERRLYYSESDNCCLYDGQIERVNVTITFDDRETVQQNIDGGTSCRNYYIDHRDRIQPGQSMDYYECFKNFTDPDHYCDQLIFDQKTTWHRPFFIITSIVQNATIRNPASFDKNKYTCVMEGDGKIQHFGPSGSIPPPKIQVSCTRLRQNNLEIEQA